MKTIPLIHKVVNNIDKYKVLDLYDYCIVFGNLESGWNCNKKELTNAWNKAIRYSRHKTFGDVTLYYKGQLIRSLHNGEYKLLDKDRQYYCCYTKYKIKEND